METAAFPLDFFNEYTLSLRGRTSQGVILFKNQMLALVDKSKQIPTKPDVSEENKNFNAPRMYNLHCQLIEKSM
jgi:hypothetical protein|tara:strand:+ start:472 stop:693 length:222 start_codon:yes stop_codon:yes gene_type:complete